MLAVAAASFGALTHDATAQVLRVASPSPSPSPSASPVPPGSPALYDTFTKGMQKQSGLFGILARDQEYFLELAPEQLDHTYLVATTFASGVGGYGIVPGQYIGQKLLTFKRIANRVFVIEPNTAFSAPPGSPQAISLHNSVPDSVQFVMPILAEDPESKHIVVSAAPFLGEFGGAAQAINQARNAAGTIFGGAYHADPSRSYVEFVRTYAQNLNIGVALTYTGAGVAGFSAVDPSSILVHVHQSIVEIPPNDAYVPRLADDRVGYFYTEKKVFDAPAASNDPLVRYVERWDLSKGPVVFYLTNEIPATYRPVVRRALLRWNDAFAAIGYPHAVEVRDQPADPAWDPDDIRYSTVRWATSDEPTFSAEGQVLTNPATGQIFRASILIDGEAIANVRRGYVPASASDSMGMQQVPYAATTAASAAYALTALQLRSPTMSAAQKDAFVKNVLFGIVLHETGHAFGLRHNFAASSIYSLAQLHDKRFTSVHGIAGSVMDYLPVNIGLAGGRDGDLMQMHLGPWDYWAIKYGYERFSGVRTARAETPMLQRIADESTLPQYAFGTDEDELGVNGYDPHIQAGDLSSDPLGYERERFEDVRHNIEMLDRAYPRDDRSYGAERTAFETLLSQYETTAFLATRYVGGYYTSRSHRGQAGRTAPYQPVPRAQQLAALRMLAQNVFSSNALPLSAALQNDLGPDRFAPFVSVLLSRDYSATQRIADVQWEMIGLLFAPDTLARIREGAMRAGGHGTALSLEDLFSVTDSAVWDSLANPKLRTIGSAHRSLQRLYAERLMSMAALNGSPRRVVIGPFLLNPPPSDGQELARYHLEQTARRIAKTLRLRSLDVPTRAHLEDMLARIDGTLHAISVRSAGPV